MSSPVSLVVLVADIVAATCCGDIVVVVVVVMVAKAVVTTEDGEDVVLGFIEIELVGGGDRVVVEVTCHPVTDTVAVLLVEAVEVETLDEPVEVLAYVEKVVVWVTDTFSPGPVARVNVVLVVVFVGCSMVVLPADGNAALPRSSCGVALAGSSCEVSLASSAIKRITDVVVEPVVAPVGCINVELPNDGNAILASSPAESFAESVASRPSLS